jgi:hypothetical protein
LNHHGNKVPSPAAFAPADDLVVGIIISANSAKILFQRRKETWFFVFGKCETSNKTPIVVEETAVPSKNATFLVLFFYPFVKLLDKYIIFS